MENTRKGMLKEVLEGLSRDQKMLPSKFFYDERGSQLFEEITELEEYYPTRTERKILKENVREIESYLGKKVELIEPGSGSSEKTRILLANMSNICCYVPMDISGDYLYKVADRLREEFPHIRIAPLQADYTQDFELPEFDPEARKVVFFPGSTIGNFRKTRFRLFMDVISDMVGPDGALLIGVDLKKEVHVLEAAYNDEKGITAEFNKNILTHINRELGTDFDVDKFRHESVWNENDGRIEMHLFAKEDHQVQVNGSTISFSEGESIHTENSHKYTLEDFAEMVAPWFEVKKVWTDENDYFSVQYLEQK